MVPEHIPRVECPYQWEDSQTNKTVLKLSLAGSGKDFLFVGGLRGNGSSFVPGATTDQTGVILDWGGLSVTRSISRHHPMRMRLFRRRTRTPPARRACSAACVRGGRLCHFCNTW
jgi:hypothetical protein